MGDNPLVVFIAIGVGIVAGIVLLVIQNVINGKAKLPLFIVGWILFGLSLLGLIIASIVYTVGSAGSFGLFLLFALTGIFVFLGIALFVGFGASSLTEGLRKDKEGKRNKEAIIRGTILLTLAVLVVITIIVTTSILLNMESNKDEPVRMMISLL